ncbi:MAG TPA: zinc ribbon domain-containing protein [Blastocatellia bacterium]|nr:zinc ribbon domain-containing protein [Blastocatellia bacterium]
MYCPKCGALAVEGQRFCKTCGTNLELVGEALEGGEDTLGQLRIDVEALKKSAKDFARNVSGAVNSHHARHRHRESGEPRMPRPKEWLSYSWQHNLKNGLLSLFGGAGLGAALYYLGQVAINQGAISSIRELNEGQIHGLEELVQWVWLFALIPIMKGVAQILYAALFAESIATLAERFTPRQLSPQPESIQQPQATAPSATAPITSNISPFEEPPPSVTEGTTEIFDAAPRAKREAQ